jgi:hypothetical protein
VSHRAIPSLYGLSDEAWAWREMIREKEGDNAQKNPT